jgi:hypothetical protein
MGIRRNWISDSEKARRARQRQQSLAAVEQLLYSRRQTAHVLGDISIATVQRVEKRGLLDIVRLAGSPTGAVFHRARQVHELAEGSVEAARSAAELGA